MTGRPPAAVSAALAVLLLAGGCRPDARRPPIPPRDATEAAIDLFRLAGTDSPPRETLFQVVDEQAAHGRIAPLADALALLPSSPDAAKVAESPLPDGGRAVDLEVSTPSGGRMRLSVHAAPRSDGTWRVIAFSGPGLSWPPAASPRGDGTSTSAPPR